jgi:hypothetical protein
MIRTASLQRRLFVLVIFLVSNISSFSHAFQIEIENNKLSVDANQVPMQVLLKKISGDHGIALRMDPAINPSVTASFQNRDLEDGLKSILKPYNHAFFWKSNPDFSSTPSAPAYLLAQIHVFRPGAREQMIEINATPKVSATEPQTTPATKIKIKGNKVFVPVTVAYQDKVVETTLLFDTGASSIVLHEDVAEQLEIDDYTNSQGRGVGGVRISTKATRLTYVTVGPNRKENLRADIIKYRGPADGDYNGLLGMNFIRGLKYTIDFESQTIQWRP